jgi:hypothetical protein
MSTGAGHHLQAIEKLPSRELDARAVVFPNPRELVEKI